MITGLKRVSTPGRRVYVRQDRHPAGAGRARHVDPVHFAGRHDRPGGPRGGSRRRAPRAGLVGGRHVASRQEDRRDPERRHGRPSADARRHGQGPEGRAAPCPVLAGHRRARSRATQVTRVTAERKIARNPACSARCGRSSRTWSWASRRVSARRSRSGHRLPRARWTARSWCCSSATRTRSSSRRPRASRSRSRARRK